MARTAPVPNIPAIPGMNPGLFVLGGGGDGGGSGAGAGKGGKKGQGADGKNGGKDAQGGGKSACGGGGKDGGGCPRHHGGSNSGAAAQGDPIDVVTGRVFTLPSVDLFLPGPLPLTFSRMYSSTLRDRDAGLGYGVSHSLAWRIEERRARTLLWTEDGLDISFGRVEAGSAAIGPHGWVLHREGAGFSLDAPDGTRRLFEPDTSDPGAGLHRLAAITDRHGNRISIQYEGAGIAAVEDSVGRKVLFRSTREGRIAFIEVLVPSGRLFPAMRYEYDDAGNLAAAIDAGGHATTYEYDAEHRLVAYRLPTGLRFHFRYDEAGRGVETWGELEGGDPCLDDGLPDTLADGRTRARGIHHVKIDYGPDGYSEVVDATCVFRYFGNEHGKVDKAVAGGKVFSRTYDARGHLTSYTNALGATTSWERDLWGNETSITDALGHRTTLSRRANGDIEKIIEPDGAETTLSYLADGFVLKDPTGATYQWRYDARGLLVETIAPNGRRRLYQHDAHGNAVLATDGRDVLWGATFDELGRCTSFCEEGHAPTRYSYSDEGRMTRMEEPGGGVTSFEHDGLGNVIGTIDPSGRRTVLVRGGTGSLAEARLPDGTVVKLRYDRKERLVAVWNGRGEKHTIELDPQGIVLCERSFDGGEVRYAHDAEGRVVRVELPDGEVTELERDLLGRIVKRTRSDGSEERFVHDHRGDVTVAATKDVTVELVRNAEGDVVKERQIVDGVTFEATIEHDAVGMPVVLRTSLGHEIAWRRDYDARRTQVFLEGRPAATVRLDLAGREVERLLAGGGRMQFTYDLAGQLIAQRVFAPSLARTSGGAEPAWIGADPTATVDQRLEYSAAAELTSRWDARLGTIRYAYDAVGQLVSCVPEGARGEQFAYDVDGNVHPGDRLAARREYGPGDRLLRSGPVLYRHDERGRLIERSSRRGEEDGGGDLTAAFRWTSAGTLAAVKLEGGVEIELSYDAFGRRVKKDVYRVSPSGARELLRSTRFCWFENTMLHEVTTSPDARFERRYVFDGEGEPWAHRERITAGGATQEGDWLYYVNDLSGFPERLVGGDGRVASEIARTAWGAASFTGGAPRTPIRFRGQYADEETGLHYNRYRYYDPEAGRYISPDPMELLGGLNPFRYALNNPFFFSDPLGLVYSRIVDNSTDPPKILYEGYNIDEARGKKPEAGGQIPQSFTDKSCAETQALQRMKNDITAEIKAEQAAAKKKGTKKEPFKPMTDAEIDAEANKRLKAKFDNPNVSIETFQNKGGPRVNPCDSCAGMFKTLGIEHAVVGDKGKRGEFGKYRKPKG